MRKPIITVLALIFVFGGALAACGDDDGAAVRDCGEGSASGGSASAGSASAGSASGGGSGSGADCSSSAPVDTSLTVDNALVDEALVQYKAYVLDQIDTTIAATTEFTDAVRAGDLEAAKELYAPSRQGWEAIEPVAGLVEEIDGAVDARVDDFEGEDDPAFTGWHRIEYILWELGTTDGAAEFADGLDENLQVLQDEVEAMDEIPPAALVVGASELIEEVSTGKITGEEDRYSHTDLWDFAANVEGSEYGVELLAPALEEADPDLLADIQANFEELDAQLAEYEDGEGGYVSYEELTEEDKTAMTATLAELSENLSLMAGALGLQ
ncbi:MAG: iron uptake system protein EfeO [Acidimicrobiales bacterium]